MKFKFNWVLINELAISSAPNNEKFLDYIKNEGIKSILTLCSETEVYLPKKINLEFVHKRIILPDHSYKEDLKFHHIKKSLDMICELKKNGPVLVHCYAGVERAPLICIAWLINKKGYDMETSLRYLMHVNPGTNPLPKQLSLLRDLNIEKNN